MVGDLSQQMKTQICTVEDIGDGFRSLPIPLIAGFQFPITHKHGVSGTDLWQLSDISAKSKTVSKKQNPWLSGIFPTYENQA